MEIQMTSVRRSDTGAESALRVSIAAYSLTRSPTPTPAVSVPDFHTLHSPIAADSSHQGSDVHPTIWTVVELCIGILSACLPTMRPLFSRTRAKVGSGAEREREQEQEKSGSRGRSNQSLSSQESKSVPSQSRHFAHLGVLADVEHAQEEVAPEKW